MAKIEDIERRLLNWARWKLGGTSGGLGYAKVRYGDGVTASRYREAVIPTNDCEAEETDRAVGELGAQARRVVEVEYLSGKTMRWKVAFLGRSESSIKATIWQAHRDIAQWVARREERARAERIRVEDLQSRR